MTDLRGDSCLMIENRMLDLQIKSEKNQKGRERLIKKIWTVFIVGVLSAYFACAVQAGEIQGYNSNPVQTGSNWEIDNNGVLIIKDDVAARWKEWLSDDDDKNRIKTVRFDYSVDTIYSHEFEYCTSLESITIPSTVTTLEQYAFNGCTSLSNVVFENGSSIDQLQIYTFNGCKALKHVTLPDTLVEIGDFAFYHCEALESMDLRNCTSLKKIDKNAFEWCISLNKIDFPESLEEIGFGAFAECESIKSIYFPDSVKKLGQKAFFRCDSLEEIKGGNNISELPDLPKYNEAMVFYYNGEGEYDTTGDGTLDSKLTRLETENELLKNYSWYYDFRVITTGKEEFYFKPEPTEKSYGEYKVSYNSAAPFFGNNKKFDTERAIEIVFGNIYVNYNGERYKVLKAKAKIKGNKGYLQLLETENTDKAFNKKIKKLTKGTKGLEVNIHKYYITDANSQRALSIEKKGDGVKSIRFMFGSMNKKRYKVKKDEYSIDNGIITFKGNNLAGSCTIPEVST